MAGGDQLPQVVPLDAPSQRPDEPVTAGAAGGLGPGPAAAGIPSSLQKADLTNLQNLLPGLQAIASMPNSNPSTRAFVRQLMALGAQ